MMMTSKNLFLLLLITLFVILPPPNKADNLPTTTTVTSRSRRKLHVGKEDGNSEALNNFLENVLKAKDQLRSIESTIYPRVHRHQSYETGRKLLWTKNVEARSLTDQDKKKILRLIEQKRSLMTGKRDNGDLRIEKRHYLVADSTEGGVIEYYDYDKDMKKRDIPNKIVPPEIDQTPLPYPETLTEEERKKMENITKTREKQEKKVYKPAQLLFLGENVHPQVVKKTKSPPKKTSYTRDRKDLLKNNTKHATRNIQNNSTNVDGRQAPYRSDQDKAVNDDDSKHNQTIKMKKSKISAINEDLFDNDFDDDPQLLFKIAEMEGNGLNNNSASNLSKLTNTSSSGSNYNDLKATDDMFKGGIEQESNIDDIMYRDSQAAKHNEAYSRWKTVKGFGNEQSDKQIYHTDEVYPVSLPTIGTLVNTNVKSSVESRDKRSSMNVGPIMRHESIVEPANWPWEDYDEKDETRIRFGRGLMQVSRTRNVKSTVRELSTTTAAAAAGRLIGPQATYNGHSTSESSFQDYLKNLKHSSGHSTTLNFTHSHHTNKHEIIHEKMMKNRLAMKQYFSDKKKRFKRRFRLNGYNNTKIQQELTGDVAKQIVNRIHENVNDNVELKSRLGSELSKVNQPKIVNILPFQPTNENHKEINQTEEIMKHLMKLLDRLVIEQVQQESCIKLSNEQHDFLVWMVADPNSVYDTQNYDNQLWTNGQSSVEKVNYQYLFPDRINNPRSTVHHNSTELADYHKKIRLLKTLINEYHSLTKKEQTKVQTVHDYLNKKLAALTNLTKSKENENQHSVIDLTNKRRRRHIVKNQMKSHEFVNSSNTPHNKQLTLNPLNNFDWEIPRIFYPIGIFSSSASARRLQRNNNTSHVNNPSMITAELMRDFYSSTRKTQRKNDRWSKEFENATASNFVLSTTSDELSIDTIHDKISTITSSTVVPLVTVEALQNPNKTNHANRFSTSTSSSNCSTTSDAKIITNTSKSPSIHKYQNITDDLIVQLKNAKNWKYKVNILPH